MPHVLSFLPHVANMVVNVNWATILCFYPREEEKHSLLWHGHWKQLCIKGCSVSFMSFLTLLSSRKLLRCSSKSLVSITSWSIILNLKKAYYRLKVRRKEIHNTQLLELPLRPSRIVLIGSFVRIGMPLSL